MRSLTLIRKSLEHYWKSNIAVLLGIATAVAVLAGALLVGDSVRASLRSLVLSQFGQTDDVITSSTYVFTERLVTEMTARPEFQRSYSDACPLLIFDAVISNADSNRRSGGVQVYGIDERFARFHELAGVELPAGNQVIVSQALIDELALKAGDSVILRIEKPSAIPTESLHGRKENSGVTLRSNVSIAPNKVSEFSLRPQQSGVKSVFVPLTRLQRSLEQDAKVNAILLRRNGKSQVVEDYVRDVRASLTESFTLADLGLKVRPLEGRGAIVLESDSALINDAIATSANQTASGLTLRSSPVLTYLANSFSSGERSVPYSLVTAIDPIDYARLKGGASEATTPILINDWTARELGAAKGSPIKLEYYLWKENGELDTVLAEFVVDGIVPMSSTLLDRNYAPEYPGITEAENLADWDPPFPIDLSRVRPVDETYWHTYKTTPKAFIPLADGQRLWKSRFGELTSIRFYSNPGTDLTELGANYSSKLKSSIDPLSAGFTITPVREQALQASGGATDFGEYFTYFSFFIVAAALLLAALFFRLGIEQRVREIGLLRSIGFGLRAVQKLFLGEGAVLALLGAILGIAGAVGYAALMMLGLRTWWLGAVGTTLLKLEVRPVTLIIGAVAAIVAAIVCLILTLRSFSRKAPRSLLSGAALISDSTLSDKSGWRAKIGTLIYAVCGIGVLSSVVAAFAGVLGQTAAFFIAGVLLLIAVVRFWYDRMRSDKQTTITASGLWSIVRLGFRNAAARPGRSALCIALIASATFIISAVDAFRRDGGAVTLLDRQSGTGGYSLLGESLLPIVNDPQTDSGREALNLSGEQLTSQINIERFRLRPGDDSSCLNLFRPTNPRILGARDEFIRSNRFSFAASLAESNEERANPWLILNRSLPDGAVPVIGDANSLQYVLHLKVGEDILLQGEGTDQVRLRVVAALSDSVLQGELVISEKNFLRLFPNVQGYRYFLVDVPDGKSGEVLTSLEDKLSDYGFDGTPTDERLAGYHRVENTYLSTFQTLGALGLLLGTIGLAAVLARNVLERQREMALLRAVGYRNRDFTTMIVAENALLLVLGAASGLVCSLIAIAPAIWQRGGGLPLRTIVLPLLVVAVGLIASALAMRIARATPLVGALKTE